MISSLLILLVCICSVYSEETAESRIEISGDSSAIAEDASGTFLFTLDNVNQNATVFNANQSSKMVSLDKIIPSENCDAALVVTGSEGNETVYLVQVSNPVYSVDNKTLSSSVLPEKYYDGTLLKEYAENQSEIQSGEFAKTKVFLEYNIPELENC